MKLIIKGYVDELSTSLIPIEDLMSEMESGAIERPELDVLDENAGINIHIALLFVEGNSKPVGWLVSRLGNDDSINYVVCKSSGTDKLIEGVIFCGAPKNIINSAVLQREEVIQVVSFCLEKGADFHGYVSRPFKEVFQPW